MKTLAESLFDSDIVSKDLKVEFLYGLIDSVHIYADRYMDYLDERKINKDFNEVMKKFEPQDWNVNPRDSMKHIQKMESNELLRKLLYILSTKILSTDLIDTWRDDKKMTKLITDVLKEYMTDKSDKHLDIFMYSMTDKENHINIVFTYLGNNNKRFEAGHISFNVDISNFS